MSYKYHMTVSPLDGSVYVSDPEGHQVLKLHKSDADSEPAYKTVVFAGSGQRCLPGDRNKCGDGGTALKARLSYPKGEDTVCEGASYGKYIVCE